MSERTVVMSVYETHVTVRCPDPVELARLEAWAAGRELKVTHIVLARGRMVSQPMLTLPDRDGHESLVPRLRAAGFDPVNEPLPVGPQPVEVAGVPLLGATRELSLAWKLVWQAGDMYPQGKDLYDAVLLAESCALPYPLLAEAFRFQTDWAAFHKEYPGIPGSAESYADRLLKALAPTFAAGLDA